MRAWDSLIAPPVDQTPRIKACEQTQAKARERIKRLALLYADGDLDREGYDLGRAQAQVDLEAAEAELKRLGALERPASSLPQIEEVLNLAGGWGEAVRHGPLTGQRDVLAELIDHVVASRVGRGQYRATIMWTDLGKQLVLLSQATERGLSVA